jgi:hypothetical protein
MACKKFYDPPFTSQEVRSSLAPPSAQFPAGVQGVAPFLPAIVVAAVVIMLVDKKDGDRWLVVKAKWIEVVWFRKRARHNINQEFQTLASRFGPKRGILLHSGPLTQYYGYFP